MHKGKIKTEAWCLTVKERILRRTQKRLKFSIVFSVALVFLKIKKQTNHKMAIITSL